MPVAQILTLLLAALFLALIIIPLTSRLAQRVGALDHPDQRKSHSHPTPRLGGLGIAVALMLPLLLLTAAEPGVVAFVAGALVVVATGFIDDVVGMRPRYKFLGQTLAVVVFLLLGGPSLTSFGDLLGFGPIDLGSFGMPLTFVCLVGMMNATNLIDGLDGLAGGLCLIACIFLGIFAFQQQNWLCLSILIPLAGALLGFLRYNCFPARLFMGDTGSLLLGYVLAAVAILLVENNDAAGASIAPISMVLIVALPVVDMFQVMARRMWHGESPFSPDRSHFHHRLVAIGMPKSMVVLLMYLLMAGFGLLALFMRGMPHYMQFGTGVLSSLLLFTLVFYSHKLGIRWPAEAETVEVESS
ncbi:MAG: MraY family glycosyltransferase [Mariprofundaceae bacterium]